MGLQVLCSFSIEEMKARQLGGALETGVGVRASSLSHQSNGKDDPYAPFDSIGLLQGLCKRAQCFHVVDLEVRQV
jgi:hypothetical protein